MCKNYVLNTRTMVYHTLQCYCHDMIHKENLTIVEGKPTGAKPCTKCNPDIHKFTSLDEVLA